MVDCAAQKLTLSQHVFPSVGYDLPWECKGEGWEYPSTFAPPLQVAIEASDGASDYGNKFGEPVLSGRTTVHTKHISLNKNANPILSLLLQKIHFVSFPQTASQKHCIFKSVTCFLT